MAGYIASRLVQAIFVVLGVTFVTFALMYLSGDPVHIYAARTGQNWTIDQLDEFRERMGFDKPWPVQYVNYIGRVLHGDFGESLRYRREVLPLIVERMPATLSLAFAAFLISIIVPVPLGIIAATHRARWPDALATLVAIAGQSIPGFWLGILLILVFGLKLQVLPISGTGSPLHLVLPAITLAAYSVGSNTRMVRSSMLEEFGHDYVRTAKAKGLTERTVLWRHAFRNSLLSVTSLIGLELGYLLGGAVITETIFAWPGLGSLTIQAIQAKDLILVQGTVTWLAVVFVIVNLGVDILYMAIDPRIRLVNRE